MHAIFEGTAEGVRNEMRAFLGLDQPATPPTSPKAAKATKPEVGAPVASAPTPSEAPAPPATQTVAAGAAAPATGPITIDMVRDLVPRVAAKQGRPKAVELLAEYGAKSGKDVLEKDWPAFVKKAEALLV